MLPDRGPILPAHITDDLLRQMQTMLKVDDYLVLTGDASNVEAPPSTSAWQMPPGVWAHGYCWMPAVLTWQKGSGQNHTW